MGIKIAEIFTQEEMFKRKGVDMDFIEISSVKNKQRRTISEFVKTIDLQDIQPVQGEKCAAEQF